MQPVEDAVREAFSRVSRVAPDELLGLVTQETVTSLLDSHGVSACEDLLIFASEQENPECYLGIHSMLVRVLAMRGDYERAQEIAELLCAQDDDGDLLGTRPFVRALLSEATSDSHKIELCELCEQAAASIRDAEEQLLGYRDIYLATGGWESAADAITSLTNEAYVRNDFAAASLGLLVHGELTCHGKYFDAAARLIPSITEPDARKDVEEYFNDIFRELTEDTTETLRRELALPETQDRLTRVRHAEAQRHVCN